MVTVLMMIDDAAVGGGQQHVLWLAERLDRQRFQVAVACEDQGYLVDELWKKGITVYPLSMSNYLSLTSLWRCVRLLRRVAPSVLHTHGGTAGFVGRVASLFAPVKAIIHTYHGIHYLHFGLSIRKILYTWVDRFLLNWTDCVICVAQADFELGCRYSVASSSKSIVIKYGINVQEYAVSFQSDNMRKHLKGNIVGTVGRLHVQKGQLYLLEAARLVLKKFPNTLFQIIGEGELRGALEQQSRELGIEHNVQFLGSRSDIPEVLAAMDIFVLPSLWEGLPIVILEAMAAKKSIVSTEVDGVPEMLVNERDGLLVPPRNVEKLAQAITLLLGNRGLAEDLGKNAFDKVVSQFDITTMVSRIEELYENVLADNA